MAAAAAQGIEWRRAVRTAGDRRQLRRGSAVRQRLSQNKNKKTEKLRKRKKKTPGHGPIKNSISGFDITIYFVWLWYVLM